MPSPPASMPLAGTLSSSLRALSLALAMGAATPSLVGAQVTYFERPPTPDQLREALLAPAAAPSALPADRGSAPSNGSRVRGIVWQKGSEATTAVTSSATNAGANVAANGGTSVGSNGGTSVGSNGGTNVGSNAGTSVASNPVTGGAIYAASSGAASSAAQAAPTGAAGSAAVALPVAPAGLLAPFTSAPVGSGSGFSTGSPAAALPITFDLGSSRVEQGSLPYIETIATVMRSDPSMQLAIEGHTDDRGPYNRNMVLSWERALGVFRALVESYGIEPRRLQPVGKGPLEPMPGTSPHNGANRRVQFRVIG